MSMLNIFRYSACLKRPLYYSGKCLKTHQSTQTKQTNKNKKNKLERKKEKIKSNKRTQPAKVGNTARQAYSARTISCLDIYLCPCLWPVWAMPLALARYVCCKQCFVPICLCGIQENDLSLIAFFNNLPCIIYYI